jgi:hypothetical protein
MQHCQTLVCFPGTVTWFIITLIILCRFQWPRGLRRGSAAARLPGFRVRISPVTWIHITCECCVLSGRGLCYGLITRPEESYRVWCVWVWSWSLDNEEVNGPRWAAVPRQKILYRTLWDSPVGIATRYGLDGTGMESRGGELFRTPSRPTRAPLILLYNGYRFSFPGFHWSWRVVDRPPHLAPRLNKQ